MKIIQFNFNNYFDNPIVKYCHNKLAQNYDITVYTLGDLLPIIKNLNHANNALESKKWSYIGDQLRLYLGISEDIIYIDGDVLINDLDYIVKNECIAYEPHFNQLNNGAFFHGCKKFNQYYFDLYEKDNSLYTMSNLEVFYKYPYTENLNKIVNNHYHFYMSLFRETFNKAIVTVQGSDSYIDAGPKSDIVHLNLAECAFINKDTIYNLAIEQLKYMNKEVVNV